MANENKYLDYDGVDNLWKHIDSAFERKKIKIQLALVSEDTDDYSYEVTPGTDNYIGGTYYSYNITLKRNDVDFIFIPQSPCSIERVGFATGVLEDHVKIYIPHQAPLSLPTGGADLYMTTFTDEVESIKSHYHETFLPPNSLYVWIKQPGLTILMWYYYRWYVVTEKDIPVTSSISDNEIIPVTSKAIYKYHEGIKDDRGDDVARYILGGDWKIPSTDNWFELIKYTTSVEETVSNRKGRRYTGTNGNSIFIPYVGYYAGKTLVDGSYSAGIGYYWSNQHNFASDSLSAYCTNITNNTNSTTDTLYKYYGLPIRPVSNIEGIDLGLPSGIKWRDKNLYAETIYLPGDYFAWGEIYNKSNYSKDNYKFIKKFSTTEYGATKYNSVDGKSTLETDGKTLCATIYNSDGSLAYILNGNNKIVPKKHADIIDGAIITDDVNNCVPDVSSYYNKTTSVSKVYSLDYNATNRPTSESLNWNIITTVYKYSTSTSAYRLTQLAQPCGSTNPTALYVRSGNGTYDSTTKKVTWNFGSWLSMANTDEKVKQSADFSSTRRKLLLSYNNTNTAGGEITSGTTNQVYYTNKIEADSSNGMLYAPYFVAKNGNFLVRDGDSGTYNRVAISIDGIFMKDANHKSTVSINSAAGGGIALTDSTTASTTPTVDIDNSGFISLRPVTRDSSLHIPRIDFGAQDDTSTGYTRLYSPAPNQLNVINGELHNATYDYLPNYATGTGDGTYTVTETDGKCGMVCAGTSGKTNKVTLPAFDENHTYNVGRHFWCAVPYNALGCTVDYVGHENITHTISLGSGQACEFVVISGGFWACLTQGLQQSVTIDSSTSTASNPFTLSQYDGITTIYGTGYVNLPISAGWEGRTIKVIGESSSNTTGGGLFVTRNYVGTDGNIITPYRSIFDSCESGVYTFINGGWYKSGGRCFYSTSSDYTLTAGNDIDILSANSSSSVLTFTLPYNVYKIGSKVTIASNSSKATTVVYGYSDTATKTISVPAYHHVTMVKTAQTRWTPEYGVTIS